MTFIEIILICIAIVGLLSSFFFYYHRRMSELATLAQRVKQAEDDLLADIDLIGKENLKKTSTGMVLLEMLGENIVPQTNFLSSDRVESERLAAIYSKDLQIDGSQPDIRPSGPLSSEGWSISAEDLSMSLQRQLEKQDTLCEKARSELALIRAQAQNQVRTLARTRALLRSVTRSREMDTVRRSQEQKRAQLMVDSLVKSLAQMREMECCKVQIIEARIELARQLTHALARAREMQSQQTMLVKARELELQKSLLKKAHELDMQEKDIEKSRAVLAGQVQKQ